MSVTYFYSMRQFHFTSFPCDCNLVPISPINEILDRKKTKWIKRNQHWVDCSPHFPFTQPLCATNLCKVRAGLFITLFLHYLYFLTPSNIHYSYQEKKKSHQIYWHIHKVLNEVYLQNFLHGWAINRETNLMSPLNP